MNYKHGDCNTRFYSIWYGMITRCKNINSRYYKNGIIVCDDWHNYNNFKNDMYDSYYKHIKEYGEDNTSIDRIDVYGNYEKKNCRWATNKQQSCNRTSNTIYNIDGVALTQSQLCEKYNIKLGTFLTRLKYGWDIDKIISTPVVFGQRTQQQRIEYLGRNFTIAEWSKIINELPCTLRMRLKRGWEISRALNNITEKEIEEYDI